MASNLRQKKQIDYRVLHEGESLRLGKETMSTPEVLDSTFYVERLISKKRDNGKSVSITLSLSLSLSLSLWLLLGSRLFIYLFTSCTIFMMLFKIKILYYIISL